MPAASNTPRPRNHAAGLVTKPRKSTARSRVTNGTRILEGIDWRSAIARRYTDLVAVVCQNKGGRDEMSEAQLQLARRFAALSVQLEALETRLVNGEGINLVEYSQLTSTLVRVVSRLGVGKVTDSDGQSPLQRHLATIKQIEHQERPQGDGAVP
jgi:hypothetical protein